MQNQSCLTIESNSSYLSDQLDSQSFNAMVLQQESEQKSQLLLDIHTASKRLSHSADHYVKEIVESMEHHIKKIIKIQSYYRMFACKKKYNLIKKWARYRKFVLQELVDSEFTYVKDLEFIIKNIYEPLQGIIGEPILQKLFLNLKQIYQLNKQFLIEISERFNTFTQQSCFGKIFDKYVQFFKIYFEYTSNFSIDVIQQIRKDFPNLDNFITNIEEEDRFNGKKLDAYLIKPVQRLPKYVLLLKDLIKHTWNTHPDYYKLQESLVKFIDVNQRIDKLMDKFLKNQMLFELQKQLFEPIGINIVESTRLYIESETLNVLVSKQQKSVIVHICNDMIILTQRNQNALIYQHEKLYDYLFFNDKSYCKNKPETQYCKFLFTVCSSDKQLTLICSDAQQKQRLLKLFSDLIDNLKSKPQNLIIVQDEGVQPIKVYAKGTELRKTLFQSYTVYVMLISAGSQNLTLSTRYSSLIKLEILLRLEYPDIVIPHLSKNQWKNNKKTQLIEARKIIIENFIEATLNSPIVKANPEKVLKYLELPPSFYETITSSPCKLSVERESYRKTMKSSSFNIDEISMSDTMRFVRGSNRLRQTMHSKSMKLMETINIKILFMDEFYIFLPISPELRIAELIEMAAESLKLQSSYDFRLFLINGQECRILDDEDSIPQQEEKQQNQGLMTKIQGFFKEKPRTTIQLLMKKYFYLSLKQEKKDFQSDLVRLNLICHQTFDDVKNLKFKLSFSQYCVYSIYFLIIKYYAHFKHIFTKQSLPINLIKQMIPDKIFKQEKESTWIVEIFNAIAVVKKEISQIIKQNDDNLVGLKKQEQQYQYITQLLFMESISANELYGLQLFQIEVVNQTKDIIQKLYNCQSDTFATLGIKYDKFIILNNQKIILEIPINEIVNTQPFPFSFQFELQSTPDVTLCFKTTNGLEIQKLYEIYLDISKNLLE